GKDSRAVTGIFNGDMGITAAPEAYPQIFATPRLFAIAETGMDRKEPRLAGRRASELRDERPREDEERHNHRDWVSREPDQRHAANLAERDRSPRLDGQPPKVESAEPFDGGFDMILLARRDTARRDDQVVLRARLCERVNQRRLAIRTNA